MNTRVLILPAILFGFLWACKGGSQQGKGTEGATRDAALEQQLMELHDEAMAKLSTINKLSGQLRQIKSQLTETPEGKIVSPEGMESVLQELKLADQGMWDWMKSYSDTKPTIADDQLTTYYQAEMEKMKKVNVAIDQSIGKANAWLAQNGAKHE